jgi:apolipoprotein D and lipocalin family protein
VRFAAAFLGFLPFVWGDYWVIDLSPEYTYAVVGEPDCYYLCILSRTPTLPDSTIQGIVGRIRQQGYDVSGLVFTKQTLKQSQ